ncbi:hypothetical protein BDV93DRAFT_523488, partial [Ceratobasidium sp. AG-I]
VGWEHILGLVLVVHCYEHGDPWIGMGPTPWGVVSPIEDGLSHGVCGISWDQLALHPGCI